MRKPYSKAVFKNCEQKVIESFRDFKILIQQMRKTFEGMTQDLVLLCNTSNFEEPDLLSIKKIFQIIPIQDEELVYLIKPQVVPVLFFLKKSFYLAEFLLYFLSLIF